MRTAQLYALLSTAQFIETLRTAQFSALLSTTQFSAILSTVQLFTDCKFSVWHSLKQGPWSLYRELNKISEIPIWVPGEFQTVNLPGNTDSCTCPGLTGLHYTMEVAMLLDKTKMCRFEKQQVLFNSEISWQTTFGKYLLPSFDFFKSCILIVKLKNSFIVAFFLCISQTDLLIAKYVNSFPLSVVP